MSELSSLYNKCVGKVTLKLHILLRVDASFCCIQIVSLLADIHLHPELHVFYFKVFLAFLYTFDSTVIYN